MKRSLNTALDKASPPSLDIDKAFQPLRDQKNELDQIITEAKVNLNRAMEGRKLDQQIVITALARETRAKAALVAVLKQQGCSDREISEVLEKVDADE